MQLMSQFSTVLKKYVSKSDISIQTLSKTSGVDRSFIHHILTGKRIPADKEVLENIMRALTLVPAQADELRNLYFIERIGKDLYQRNLLIKNMLENLVGFDSSPPMIPTSYNHDFTAYPAATMLKGALNINTVLKAVLEEESSKENGYVKLLIQPDYQFLMDLLLTIGNSDTSLKIEHIFCLQKDTKEESDTLDNLTSFQSVLPLLLSCPHYEAYTYYDNIDSKFDTTSVFPYIIITSYIVIGISHNYQHAALYIDEGFHQVYHEIYSNIFRRCSPLAKKAIDPLEYYTQYSILNQVMSDGKNDLSFTSSLFAQPRLIFFLTNDYLNKYILDLPIKNEVKALLSKQSNLYYEKLKNGYEYTSFFTIEGLDAFWNTGRITEIPDEFYAPIKKEDCLNLLKKLYESISKTSYKACIINTSKLRITDKLVITAINETITFFMYIHPVKGMFHLALNEPGISASIFQFLTLLKESDFIYSEEETQKILLSKIEEFENELKERKREA